MNTPNTLPANGGVSDADIKAAVELCIMWPNPANSTREIVKRTLEFAQSRQPSAQGGEPEPVALAFPHSPDFSETKCPDCGKKFYVEREFATPPAGGGKEALSDAASDDEIHAIWTRVSGGDPDGWPVAREFALELRAGKKG